ncbi:hypothetical protein EJC49_21100 [Aquibium carbonis]|uniref:Uncharacterized protein n=1 Tax=Aquibium carbonis TaxID=2495581 RepID=A0A3S0A464_9HYPH|nr:hypothetical protein [Aquibium carbonis]RST84432.1 hypothetical protein EJC49_21100 [Aquibium carbonis]
MREVLGLGGTAAATLLPSRTWPALGRLASNLRYRRKRRKGYAAFLDAMQRVLGNEVEAECEAFFRNHLENLARRRFMFTIDELAGGRKPQIDVVGAERLRAALDRGRGAIVWASQFVYQTLAGKRALWEQGFRPIQISDPYHGFSDTIFGNVSINPLLRRAEGRYLKDRITFDRESGATVTRKIVSLLDQGELIILTNNLHAGSMFVEMRFGERGHVSMPTAPLSIVARRATPFFSMATLETVPFARMEAVIEPIGDATLEAADPRSKRDYESMARLALIARDNLLTQFRRAPDQFLLPAGLGRSKFEAE